VTEFIHGLGRDDVPAEVAHEVGRCLVDLVGVAVAGSTTPLSRIVRDHVAANLRGDSRTARMLFDGRAVSPVGANAAAGSASRSTVWVA